jgi:hypothetical protein
MRKVLLVLSAFAVLLLVTTEALARNPIIWNSHDNEVGVIQRFNPDGSVVMQPSRRSLGMGNYNVVLPKENLRPRDRGGWETDLTLDQLAYLPPPNPQRFWMPSGM